nr:MAG TPA: hypothetical protein [Caudoviricetes sp.]
MISGLNSLNLTLIRLSLHDICRAGDRLKTVPRSADTTWILIFCRDRVGQSGPLLGRKRDKRVF